VNPVLTEDGVIDLVASRQGFRVAFRGDFAPGRPAGLEDDHGLFRLGQGFQKVLGSLYPFHVDGDHPGMGILVEITDAVRLIDVGAVSQADEDADAEIFLARPVHQGGAYSAALGDEGHAPSVGQQGPGGAEVVMGIIDPLTVWSHHPDAIPGGGGCQLLLEFFPFHAGLGKAAGNDHRRPDAAAAALFYRAGDHPGRNHDHSQVGGRRCRLDVRIGLQAQQFIRLGVDGIDRSLETGVDEVVEDVAT